MDKKRDLPLPMTIMILMHNHEEYIIRMIETARLIKRRNRRRMSNERIAGIRRSRRRGRGKRSAAKRRGRDLPLR